MTNHEIDQSTPENFNVVTSDILSDAKKKYLSAQELDIPSLGESAMRYVKPTFSDSLDFDLRRIILRPNQFGNDLRNIHPSERGEIDPDRVNSAEFRVARSGIDRTLRRKALSLYIPSVKDIVFTNLPGVLPFALMSVDQMDGGKLQAAKKILFVESNYAQLFRLRQLNRDIFDNDLIERVADGDIDLDKPAQSFLKADIRTATIDSTTQNYANSSRLLLNWGELISENIAEW